MSNKVSKAQVARWESDLAAKIGMSDIELWIDERINTAYADLPADVRNEMIVNEVKFALARKGAK